MHSQRKDATSEQVANLFTSQCLEAEYQNTRCRMERCITCESKGQTRFKVSGCRFKYMYVRQRTCTWPQGENSHDLQRHVPVPQENLWKKKKEWERGVGASHCGKSEQQDRRRAYFVR